VEPEGRREATGRGVVYPYLVERAMNMLKVDPEKIVRRSCRDSATLDQLAALSLGYKSGVKVIGISDVTRGGSTIRKE